MPTTIAIILLVLIIGGAGVMLYRMRKASAPTQGSGGSKGPNPYDRNR